MWNGIEGRFTQSAQDAAASSFRNVKALPPRSVVRVFMERRKGAKLRKAGL
jgi:hypothetical protein